MPLFHFAQTVVWLEWRLALYIFLDARVLLLINCWEWLSPGCSQLANDSIDNRFDSDINSELNPLLKEDKNFHMDYLFLSPSIQIDTISYLLLKIDLEAFCSI